MAEDDVITIVSGVPRSGTSMMMQMLAAGGMPLLVDAERPGDVDNPRGYYEYAPVRRTRDDSDWTVDARGKAVKAIHALLEYLPESEHYRVIFMQRPLNEVVASQQKMLARLGETGSDLSEDNLIAAFDRQIDQALRYVAARHNMTLLTIDYNQTVDSPSKVAGAVNAFLGDGLDVRAMAAAVDPNLARNRGRESSG